MKKSQLRHCLNSKRWKHSARGGGEMKFALDIEKILRTKAVKYFLNFNSTSAYSICSQMTI
jgi:hypothetical protein